MVRAVTGRSLGADGVPLAHAFLGGLLAYGRREERLNMRAMWTGNIELGGTRLAVKLYAAVEDSDIHFHLLHARDHARVEQHYVDPQSGEIVPNEQIRKGFALKPGEFVLLEQDEIDALHQKAEHTFELVAFVPDDSIASAWFERPYYLGPDGDEAGHTALAQVLRDERVQAVLHWSMRGRHYTGALRAHGAQLVLLTLRSRDEVLAAPKVEVPKSRAPTPQELALAEQLVKSLDGKFDPHEWKSEHRARVLDMIEKKAHGKRLRLVKPVPRKAETGSLERALSASLKQVAVKPAPKKSREKQSA
jgi:DNA end-binding protein Ku